MHPSKYQRVVQKRVCKGESVLLVAPTGLGKTFAVAGDPYSPTRKVVYSVPLRALGSDICEAVVDFTSTTTPIRPVIHHGGLQESSLFSEEFIVTTYDQVVAAVPGLPLSLPLKAGHAVAGALLMSRLILDEVHLAWAISEQALPILFGILESRSRLGLQSVLLTATLPGKIARKVADDLGLNLITVGTEETVDDEQLLLREENRHLRVTHLDIGLKRGQDSRKVDWSVLDTQLLAQDGKRIYFANTVERIQSTYDRLVAAGADVERITILHNRMPSSWRQAAERTVRERFGKGSGSGDWILLTNQVAEAGLDISAPLVISDPAPVDTLVQRAGRCARWFRNGPIDGNFAVLRASKSLLEGPARELCGPYQSRFVVAALDSLPSGTLTWTEERNWVNEAWMGGPKDAEEYVARALEQTAFALNLFDRAAQERRPSEIATAFREILSVNVTVDAQEFLGDLPQRLNAGYRPDTSSVSLNQARQIVSAAANVAWAIRYDEGDVQAGPAAYVQPGDILIVPPTVAYLHPVKGLCFGDGTTISSDPAVVLRGPWLLQEKSNHLLAREGGRRQLLTDHVQAVMEGTEERLSRDGIYRRTLTNILRKIEPSKDPEALANAICLISTLAAAFHDLGKVDQKWQAKARSWDPSFPEGLVGRTANPTARIGIPHTPPGYRAILKAAELLLGPLGPATFLVRAIALAAVRHHSSFVNPAQVRYVFEPGPGALEFVKWALEKSGAPEQVVENAGIVLQNAKSHPGPDEVPLLLPNDELFPIYALVGRAILMADREDAADRQLEAWRSGI